VSLDALFPGVTQIDILYINFSGIFKKMGKDDTGLLHYVSFVPVSMKWFV
jgi:hypothetical protein